MVTQIQPNLHAISVSLPGSPLKTLNSYIFTSGDRNLLVDTGFNRPECMADLAGGLRELGIDMADTDILVTHLHADHAGLVGKLASPDTTVYMTETDKWTVDHPVAAVSGPLTEMETKFVDEGFPRAEILSLRKLNPTLKYGNDTPFAVTPVADGDLLTVGNRALQCVATPGHTLGHVCLYSPEDKLMITGDHILFDITPNITWWPNMPDALARYLDSLAKIRRFDVATALPAHRGLIGDFYTRIDQLIAHHQARLQEVLDLVREAPGMGGYAIAGQMHWSIRANGWEDFPLTQKWFAVGEALAHVHYLLDEGRITHRGDGYYPV